MVVKTIFEIYNYTAHIQKWSAKLETTLKWSFKRKYNSIVAKQNSTKLSQAENFCFSLFCGDVDVYSKDVTASKP